MDGFSDYGSLLDYESLMDALNVIKQTCKNAPGCAYCPLHEPDDVCTCAVSTTEKGLPFRWEFIELSKYAKSIFQK